MKLLGLRLKLTVFSGVIKKIRLPSSQKEWRKVEEAVARILLLIVILVMLYPIFFWSGYKRWIGIIIDLGILYALYKAIFRDVPTVHIGMLVSPFWGRIPKYLREGKHPILPWDKIQNEELKLKVAPIKEDQGYFTLDGAPVKMSTDIFYRIDRDNIYLYKEVEGTEGAAIDGKVREYLYGMIGGLETDEVVAHQGEIARGILGEIRLHPISSKEKMIEMRRKKEKLLEDELKIEEEGEAADAIDKKVKAEKIAEIKLKLSRIKVDIESFSKDTESLFDKEIGSYEKALKIEIEEATSEKNQERLQKAQTKLSGFECLEKDQKKKVIKLEIDEKEEDTLSELEKQFAIRVLGSRTYGLDIADEDAKKGRSKRTTALFERAAVLTEWGTTEMVMRMIKDKNPEITGRELLEASLVNRRRIQKSKQVVEIEGLREVLKEVLPEIFKIIVGAKKEARNE